MLQVSLLTHLIYKQPSPVKEGRETILPDVWYTDCPTAGQPPQWTFIAGQPLTNTLWWDTRMGQSGHWAELWAAWMVTVLEATDSPCIPTAGWSSRALVYGSPPGLQITGWFQSDHCGTRTYGKSYGSCPYENCHRVPCPSSCIVKYPTWKS